MTQKRENEETPTLIGSVEPEKSVAYHCFHLIRTIAISACILMALCQLMIFSRAEDTAWLQKVLRAYQILFCAIFVSSEFRLENKLKFLPALQNWVTRGFLYTFVSVIGYEEATTVQLSTSGKWIPDHFLIFSLKLASWTMFLVGVLYAVMGIFCLNKISDRTEERYRHDREVLTRYGAAGSTD